jgi:creatinine amidohydrolase
MKPKCRVLCLESISYDVIRNLDRTKTAVIASMSPLEVHGPHLPIGQDLMEAYSIARETAERLAERYMEWSFLLLPPVPVAADALPKLGSVNFPASTVRDVAYHLLAPFAREGFARLAFASFHGGPRHLCALEAAAEDLKNDFGVPAVSLMSAALSRLMDGKFFMGALGNVEGCMMTAEKMVEDRHAGFVETSLALHLWPEKVQAGWETLPPSVPEGSDGGSFLFEKTEGEGLLAAAKRAGRTVSSITGVVKHFRDSTYFGYPAFSSAGAGKALFELLADLSAGIGAELIDRGLLMDGHSPLWRYRTVFLNTVAGRIVDELQGTYKREPVRA